MMKMEMCKGAVVYRLISIESLASLGGLCSEVSLHMCMRAVGICTTLGCEGFIILSMHLKWMMYNVLCNIINKPLRWCIQTLGISLSDGR